MGPVDDYRVRTKTLVSALLILVGIAFTMGVASLFSVSASRASGFVPHKGTALYTAHALLGIPLVIGTGELVLRNRRARRGGDRTLLLAAWLGAIGIGLAVIGGLLTALHPARLAGMALMFVGPMFAGFGFLVPILESSAVRTGAVDGLSVDLRAERQSSDPPSAFGTPEPRQGEAGQ